MMRFCPECRRGYPQAVVACPSCRVVLVDEPVDREPPGDKEPEIVHRVPDAAAGSLLVGMLRHHGVEAVLRSTTLPGYGTVRRDWSTVEWGEILVPRVEADEARALIADYLAALERGGIVQDEDVEDAGPAW